MLDILGVYKAQGLTSWMDEAGIQYKVAPVEGIEGTHCYCDSEAEAALVKAIGESLGSETAIRFIGSGDYHYLSCLLAQSIREPFSLLLLDNHPDNQPPALGNVLSCGGWVNDLRERNPLLEDVLTIGPEGCPREIPQNWLESHRNVYVSLDKDIMSPQYAVTGWSQGAYTLEEIKDMLDTVLHSGVNVIAVDICGECAPHECQAVNLNSNIEILKTTINAL